MIKIVLTDDHNMFRKGLKNVLEENPNFQIIGEASDGEELILLLKTITPDIILLDINMPNMNGLDAARAIVATHPKVKILVLSMYDDTEHFEYFLNLGVSGFVLKESSIDELTKAIETIVAGKVFYSQKLLMGILNKRNTASQILLTEREIDVLTFMAKGKTNQEIADILFLSVKSIEKHRSDMIQKTQAANSLELIAFAMKNKLIPF